MYARIDRPAGVVDFRKKKQSEEVLNDWSGRLGEMLGLIEKTSHLINKVSRERGGADLGGKGVGECPARWREGVVGRRHARTSRDGRMDADSRSSSLPPASSPL